MNKKGESAFPWLAMLCLGLVFLFLFLHQRSIESERKPRLVLLFATCTLNKNYMAPYNPAVEYTPNFKQFAKESVVFTRHQTEIGSSGSAFASLYTGMLVYHHGVYYHPAWLSDENYLIAEAFRDNGYDTFFWNAHILASADWNYAQGIQPQNIIRKWLKDKRSLSIRDLKFKSILDRLRSDPKYSAYVQVNFTVTHYPYTLFSPLATTLTYCRNFPKECSDVTKEDIEYYLPLFDSSSENLRRDFDGTVKSLKLKPEEIKKFIAVVEIAYKSDVAVLDSIFGETIHAIQMTGILDDSLIVFTSDHGEVLYKKNSLYHWEHGNLEPEVIAIPLMIRLPKPNTHQRSYNGVSRIMDVFPTVAALCGMKTRWPRPPDGVDLSVGVLGKKSPPQLIAYSHDKVPHPSSGITDLKRLIVQARTEDTIYRFESMPRETAKLEVFDLSKKDEFENLFDPKNVTHQQMRRSLELYKDNLVRNYKQETEDPQKWEEVRENLRSLGYVH
jgi:Sulfatase